MNSIVIAVVIVAAIGLIAGLGLAIASIVFAVPVDEKEVKVRECLPGANCGACGYTGCDGYAKALGECECSKTNLCIPGGDKVSYEIADILGVEFQDTIEQVATVRCCGDCNTNGKKAEYKGIASCKAAKMIFGGENACTFGCLGQGDCVAACPHDAICMENGIAHVDTRKCIGCGLCAKACPNGLIHMMPDIKRNVITCSNKEKGVAAKQKCKNACIACKKCEKTCQHGAIKVIDNLAVIDYDKCEDCGECAKVCPTGRLKIVDMKNGVIG